MYKQIVLWKWHGFKFWKKAMLILSNAKESRLGEDEIDLNLNLDGTQIQNIKQEQILGVIIYNNSTWHN